MTEKIRGRLAPTPSGYLHLGNLFNFILTWGLVRQKGGELFLRMDDHDETRTRDHFVDQIFKDLHWLGFEWDHGPKNLLQWKKTSQKLNKKKYRQQLMSFKSQLFACSCTRKELAGLSTYPGTCHHCQIDFSFPPNRSIRMKGESDDPILWRKDNIPAYHWVSLMEDREKEINLIVRGDDLYEATQMQIEIERILFPNQPIFSKSHFFHHPMLTNTDEQKLSKSEGAYALKTMREGGMTAKEVFSKLSQLMNLPVQSSLKSFLDLDLASLVHGEERILFT